jgi:hypothetical protein
MKKVEAYQQKNTKVYNISTFRKCIWENCPSHGSYLHPLATSSAVVLALSAVELIIKHGIISLI